MIKELNSDPVVIVSATRTAMGAFQGIYHSVPTPKLGSVVINELITKNDLDLNIVSEVMMGCVLPAGLGQAPARQAALAAGLPNTTPCTTINKMCGSALKTITMAYNYLIADADKIIIAGGMENMSLAPYLIPKARAGLRLGHSQLLDHMFFDGLEDAYNKGLLMGHFAERTAKKYHFTRQAQDEFALISAKRALDAIANKIFDAEIAKVSYVHQGNTIEIISDEVPTKINLDKISKLKPAFLLPHEDITNGTVTAANSSSIADGASAVLLMRQSKAKSLKLKPIAKIIGYSEVANEPEWFTTAPVTAIKKLTQATGLNLKDIDLFEINEAFAVVTMAAIVDLNLDHNKVNVYGGACALGHPIGATGSRIVTTLLNAMQKQGKSLGVASLCIGGGEAMALAVELLNN